jgi:hypothetical protein
MSILLKSALNEAIDALPAKLKPNQIKPALKKAGVKDEEIELSGVLSYDDRPNAVLSAENLKEAKKFRTDEFNIREYKGGSAAEFPTKYSTVVPPGVTPAEQGYRERVYSFTHPEGVLNASTHFPDADYLMHTRVYDDLIGDADTRVVAEIQSDLHQNGLGRSAEQFSTGKPEEAEQLLEIANKARLQPETAVSRFTSFIAEEYPSLSRTDASALAIKLLDAGDVEAVKAALVPQSKAAPWETSWARKGLENEVMTAMQEGKQQIAIPIKSAAKKEVAFSSSLIDNNAASQVLSRVNTGEVGMTELDKLSNQLIEALPEELRSQDYVRQSIEHGLNEAWSRAGDREITIGDLAGWIDEGVEFNSGGIDDYGSAMASLHRSGGVQKWYETYVSPLAQKLAKQTNSKFKTEVKDGIEYAVIKFGPDTKADFKLYSAGGGLAAYMAYQQGYSQDEVTAYMREQGFGEDEIAAANTQQEQIKQAKDSGYTDEEISAFLETQQPKATQEGEAPVNPDGSPRTESMQLGTIEKQEAESRIKSDNVLPADELLADLQVIKPDMSSVTTRIGAFFGNQEMANAARATEEAAIKNIKELGKARGIEFDWDGEEWTIMTDAGPQVVTPGFLRELAASKGELVGGLGGAVYGARVGGTIFGSTPATKAAGATVGAGLGGIIGAVAGTELDYIYSSMKLQEDMSAEIAAHKSLTATEAAAYGEIVGVLAYKAGGALWRGAKRAKDFIMDGNSEGARKALRETMFLTEDEISEVVERFEQLVDTKGMSKAQKEITAVATTLPGAEDLVRAASSIDSTASRSVVRSIDSRAKQLQAEIDAVGVDNTARVLKEDFTAYTNEVKKFYGDTKMKAATAPRAKYYKFNFDKTAVMPVLESLTDNISSPAVREKFLLRLNQARKYTDGRTFADLLELRQVVNDFRFNNKIVNAKDFKAVDSVIQSIDARIEAGARFVMDKPQEWLDDYALARVKYSQMKSLEKNSLVKLLNRPGVTPDVVSSALLKHSNAIDGTYENVMGVLPKPMRELAEADMLNTLAKKYTAGEAGGMNAVQFPMFAEDLASRSFVSEHGRQMKEAITQLADTFKNDVMLSKHSGMMQVPQFQSYLTADPVVRAKYEIASTIFNKIKQSIPGSKASREIALVKLTADFLEKPLNAKTVGALKEAAKDVVGVDDAILAVQREQAEAIAKNMDSSGVKIPVYGTGNVLSSTGTGQAAMEIPAHRIASPAMVKGVADAEGLTVDSKVALDSALKRYGFKAVQYGSDKVRLLK